jgi:TatD DNase family protein
MFIDSHCHIPLIEGDSSSEDIINKALESGIKHMLVVSIDLESYPDVLDLAEKFACISASVGVHPNSKVEVEPGVEQLSSLGVHSQVVAIGETGLDYYRSEGDLEWQRERFRTHIRAAININKPLIIHSRDAKDDVIKILTEERAKTVGGVMHCFVDDWDTAEKAMDLGFYISFSGIVTFKNAQPLKDVARRVPLDRILIETDSPYLAPVPYRGKQNQPALVKHVAEHIAELRSVSIDVISQATCSNFVRLFSHAVVTD